MGKMSFTRIEHEIRPEYRKNLNFAESTEDVKKFFNYVSKELLKKTIKGKLDFNSEDIFLEPEIEVGYSISHHLMENNEFVTVFKDSDMHNILRRFAAPAVKRYKHLEKNPEKTQSKMFQFPK